MITWTNFLIALTLIYMAYYALNLVFDLFRAGSSPSGAPMEEPVFELSEQNAPIEVSELSAHDPDESNELVGLLSSGPIMATGATSLLPLLALVAQDAVVFTRQLSI